VYFIYTRINLRWWSDWLGHVRLVAFIISGWIRSLLFPLVLDGTGFIVRTADTSLRVLRLNDLGDRILANRRCN